MSPKALPLRRLRIDEQPGRQPVPPNDLDAEGAVLSALLLRPKEIGLLDGILEPHHFYADANRRIYEAVRQLVTSGKAVDIVSVAGVLRDAELLGKIGGSPYLAQLSDATPAVAHLPDHARRIVEKWRQRQAQIIGHAIVAEGAGDVGDVGVWLEQQQARLRELSSVSGAAWQTPGSVLNAWTTHGQLIHEPTGLEQLDQLTGGGPVYGTRWVLAGAPDAGKTALLVQLAHTFAERGVTVGLLAVDEEPEDIVTRLAQRIGHTRRNCEIRDPMVVEQIRAELEPLPLRFYDAQSTIESAAADLAAFAAARGSRAALFVDSLQTARCNAERAAERELAEVQAVTARVYALRQVATQHRLIAIATSELGRSAYRSGDPTLQTSTLSSAKWSGAVEYSARVLIGLRSVPDEPDLIELELAKNKFGPRDQRFHLRLERSSQSLYPVQYEPEPESSAAERAASRNRATALADAARLVAVVESNPTLNVREMRAAMRLRGVPGVERVQAALQLLGQAITKTPGPNRSMLLGVDRSLLSAEVLIALGGVQ